MRRIQLISTLIFDKDLNIRLTNSQKVCEFTMAALNEYSLRFCDAPHIDLVMFDKGIVEVVNKSIVMNDALLENQLKVDVHRWHDHINATIMVNVTSNQINLFESNPGIHRPQ